MSGEVTVPFQFSDEFRMRLSEAIASPEGYYVGKFQLLEEIGSGGTSLVFKARDILLDRLVALKLFCSLQNSVPAGEDLVDDAGETMYLQMLQEARAAAIPHHPRVVQPYEAGFMDGFFFIAFEFCEGGSLVAMLHLGPPLDTLAIVSLAADIAEALVAVHRQNLVHGDIKPANVLLTHGGRCKLADFGLARCLGRQGLLPTAGVSEGFAAPELMTTAAAAPTIASDLFAFGKVLQAMLDTSDDTDDGRGTEASRPKLHALAERMTAASPEDRPHSATAAMMELQLIAATITPETRFRNKLYRPVVRDLAFLIALITSVLLVVHVLDSRRSTASQQPSFAATPQTTSEITGSHPPLRVSLSDAKFIGELCLRKPASMICFRGRVFGCRRSASGAVTYIRFEPESQPPKFICAYFPRLYQSMMNKLGAEPETLLPGKLIEVVGRLERYRQVPEIILDSPAQITIITEPDFISRPAEPENR